MRRRNAPFAFTNRATKRILGIEFIPALGLREIISVALGIILLINFLSQIDFHLSRTIWDTNRAPCVREENLSLNQGIKELSIL